MEVAKVWHLPTREWPVVSGPIRHGHIESRQPTELVDEHGVVPVPQAQTLVEFHRRTGELSVVLVGVDSDAVREGQTLRSRKRWPCYSTVSVTQAGYGVEPGSIGTIVEVYGTAYEVEVSDSSGRTVFLGSVDDDGLELVEEWRP